MATAQLGEDRARSPVAAVCAVRADQVDGPLEADAGVAVGEHLTHGLDVLLAVAAVTAVEPMGLGEAVAGLPHAQGGGRDPQASASCPMVREE